MSPTGCHYGTVTSGWSDILSMVLSGRSNVYAGPSHKSLNAHIPNKTSHYRLTFHCMAVDNIFGLIEYAGTLIEFQKVGIK